MRVTKRSGKVEDVRFDKVVTRISNLTHGLSPAVDSSKIAQQVFSSMYDGIHTNEIDTLSAEICVGMITSDPDYETLATRIVASNIQKTAPNNFHLAMKKLRTAGVVTDDVVKVAVLVKDKISPERDFDFGYFGLKTLEKSYLQKVDGKIIETPQYMFMRVAIGIHGDSLDDVLDTYDSMSKGLFTHATPTLFNAGTPRPQMSSCFLVANKSDSIDGVYGTITECAQISKWAGGIGVHIHDVRANKSYIRGTNGSSDGIIPMLRVYNATARYVNQAGKRKGSIAVYLEPWHPDIMDFLELRLNQGDEEARCRDLFTALWIPDLFMKRVEEDGQWSLFCPDTAKGLSNCTGEEFEKLYTKYEEEGLARETVPAQRVWKAILKSQVETGTPYMLYKDAINEKSNQKNLGVIKSSNLCVPNMKMMDGVKRILVSKINILICTMENVN
jgi:ribonucleoside-diphosphate reductase alpha subunit